MTEFAHSDIGAIETVTISLARFAESGGSAAEAAMRAANGVRADVAAALSMRRAELQRAQERLRSCRRNPDANCSDFAHAVQEAQQRLKLAEQASHLVDAAVAQLEPARSRFVREVNGLTGEARSVLGRHVDRLTSYLSSSGSGASYSGTGSSTVATSVQSKTTANTASELPGTAITGAPAGIRMVPLSAIDRSHAVVTGEESFVKGYSTADLRWAFSALDEVVLPAMAAGHGTDYFRQRDSAEKLAGTRSYSDTYAGFFGDSAIRLDFGGPGCAVTNGYHRMWIAAQMGLSSVPARVR